jgi:hypothetical protein
MEEIYRFLRGELGGTYYEDPITYPGFAGLGLGEVEG